MKKLMSALLQIQQWQLEMGKDPDKDAALAGLRAAVPTQILGHMDRWFARGKKALAVAVDGSCTACHMRLPIGVIVTLRRGSDVQLCGSCGRYLYLIEAIAPPPPPAKARRRRGLQSMV